MVLGLSDSSVIPQMHHHISLKHTHSASKVQKIQTENQSVLYRFRLNTAPNLYTSKALSFHFGMAEHAHCTHLKSSRAKQMPVLLSTGKQIFNFSLVGAPEVAV